MNRGFTPVGAAGIAVKTGLSLRLFERSSGARARVGQAPVFTRSARLQGCRR